MQAVHDGSQGCFALTRERPQPDSTRDSFPMTAFEGKHDRNTTEAVVVVIEDDASVRVALKELLESVGLKVRLYASANAFLEAHNPDSTSCLVLDVRLPEVSGIKVQEKLLRAGVNVPIVFISAYADVAMAVNAIKAGAV